MSYYCNIAPRALTAWLEVTFTKDFSHCMAADESRSTSSHVQSPVCLFVCFSEMLLTTVTNIYLMPLIQSNLQLVFIAVLLK